MRNLANSDWLEIASFYLQNISLFYNAVVLAELGHRADLFPAALLDFHLLCEIHSVSN